MAIPYVATAVAGKLIDHFLTKRREKKDFAGGSSFGDVLRSAGGASASGVPGIDGIEDLLGQQKEIFEQYENYNLRSTMEHNRFNLVKNLLQNLRTG